jgi:hypothetical protein
VTDDEKEQANAFIFDYIKRKQAQGEWAPTLTGLMRVAFGAACELKNKRIAELEADIERITRTLNGG